MGAALATKEPALVGLRVENITKDNLRVLRKLMLHRDVWRNFGYQSPPTEFLLRCTWRLPGYHGLYFRREDDERTIGFALFLGPMGPGPGPEFAIAVTDPGDRGQHFGKRAAEAAEDYAFGPGKCTTLWAWGDAKNVAMLGLVRSCGWEVLGMEEEGREMVDGHADTVKVRFTVEQWRAFRRSQGRTV